ncbi:MAG: hypothetical protein SGJ11_03090 [Phycisphaerae bacterium]|nr:hypothetical protein [Phycisphaerae bacterium]
MRSNSLRWAVAMALVPLLLVLSLFGGTVFLAHDHDDHDDHDDHGTHVHAAGKEAGRFFTAAQHIAAHARESESGGPASPDSEGDLPELLGEVEGLIVSIPDQEQAVARGITAATLLSYLQFVCTVVVLCCIPPDIVDDVALRGGSCSQSPCHLCALTAGQRLVRTSQALLI